MSHLSVSQINMFFRCSQQWVFRYIDGIKMPPGIAAHVGSGVHKGSEMDLVTKRDTGKHESESVVVDAAVSGYEERLSKDGIFLSREDAPNAKKLLGEGKDQTVDLARLWYHDVAPTIEPMLIEESITMPVEGLDIPLMGIVDLLESNHTLRDLKTAGKKMSQSDADTSLQPTLYRELVKHHTGKYPSSISFDVLVKKKVPKAHRIETVRNDSDFDALVLRAQSMLKQIDAGNFGPADPGSWMCGSRWCAYWSSMCPFISDRQRKLSRTQ